MSRFRRMFRLPASRGRVERVVDEELRFHLDERVREFMERGMSRAEAEVEAQRRFGDYDRYRRQTSRIDEVAVVSANRMEFWDTIRRETIHAARSLGRARAFSAIAVVTLALGIGATTAMYTVLEGVLLRPLSYPSPNELVSVMHPTAAPGSGERKWGLSSAGYFHFREHARTLAALGVYRTSSLSVAEEGFDAVEARLAQVTSSVFDVMRARASLGRLITAADDRPREPLNKVVLSYEFWRRYYGGDSSVIGRRIETAVAPLEVIGVAEPGLTLPKPGSFSSSADMASFGVDLWVPLNLDPAERQNNHAFSGIARLAPGASADTAQRELAAMTERFPDLFPEAYSKRFMETYRFRVGVVPLLDEVLGPTVMTSLWALFGGVALVLLIACANVANLFIVRMEARRREAAIRGALGADRRHLAVHYLTESLMLTLSAGVLGVLLARATLATIILVAPRSVPRLASVDYHWTSIAFAAALSLIIGVVCGAIPLLRSGVDVVTLRDGARGLTASPRQRAMRNGLVVAQTALALVLLVGAGLMIRSFLELRNVQPGLDARGVLTLSVSLPYRTYETMDQAATFHREFARRVAALPGVVAVGGAGGLPLRDYGAGCTVVYRENRPYESGQGTPCVQTVPAIPGFFDALGIVVHGRVPTWTDVDQRTSAVVVTHALAERLWPGEDPIGKGVNSNSSDARWWYRIVGVIPELRGGGLDQPPTEAVFLPASPLYPQQQRWGMLNDIEYAVKVSRGDPHELIKPIRAILTEMNPRIPLVSPVAMQTIVDRSMARTSFIMFLLGCSAALALVLSAVGMYGVMSTLVAQRRAEIGVRVALGAPIARVLGLVMGQSVRLALAGVAIGLVCAYASTKLMRSLLFGVSPADPVVWGLVPLVLLAVATLASWAPARRATRVDPVEVLRGP
jgi:putative ABC transport system permease protein